MSFDPHCTPSYSFWLMPFQPRTCADPHGLRGDGFAESELAVFSGEVAFLNESKKHDHHSRNSSLEVSWCSSASWNRKYSATTAAELTISHRESGMTATVATTVSCCDAETGDVILLLREQEHSVLKRSELSHVEALCDVELGITQLDGWKLQVTISPGEIVQPMMQGLGPHWNDDVFGSTTSSSL